MKAAVRLLPHGLTYLVVETETTAEADLARRLAHQYSGKHLTLRCGEAGGQVVLGLEPMPADLPKEPPVHEATPQMVMRLALDASPDVHGVRYLREPAGKGTVGVSIAGKDGRTSPELDEQVHAYLVRRLPPHLKVVVQSDIGVGSYSAAPEPVVERRYVEPTRDGVGEVTVTVGGIKSVAPEPAAAPHGVGSYAAPKVPAAELRRLLELAWDRSTFRDADADVLAVIEMWLGKAAAPKAGA